MSVHIVEGIGQRGDGIVPTDRGPLHIAKVLPGERLEIADGKLKAVLTPSPERVAPFCRHYDACGGCKFQHWREDSYRTWKHGLVSRALAAQGLQSDVAALIDGHGEGRRRVTFHVRQVEGKWSAGFMTEKSHDLCVIDRCPVLSPQLQSASAAAAAFGPVLGHCDVAVTAADNGLDVSVKSERSAVDRRIPALSALLNEQKLARLSVNGEVFARRENPHVQLGKTRVVLPVLSFLQATRAGEQALVRLVSESIAKPRHVADLFCGIGTFTFPLAEVCRVSGFDSDRPAIAALSEAARNVQGLKPVSGTVRNLFNAPLTALELNDFDAVVLDPPRAGAEAQARQIAKSKVKQVSYVSCDPQTFARDASILCAGGFALTQVTPVDQFKWTAHVELVGVFRR